MKTIKNPIAVPVEPVANANSVTAAVAAANARAAASATRAANSTKNAALVRANVLPPLSHAPAPKPRPKPKADGLKLDKSMLMKVFALQNPSRNRACNDDTMERIINLCPLDKCTVIRNKGNLLIRKGPASGPHPYFLAHMDQVHDYVPFMKLHITDGVLHATDGNDDQCGVGGDDKSGIYLALMMLHVLPHCTVVFVRDEEVGCLGSGIVPLPWFDHASFVVQSDRNNSYFDVIRNTNGMVCASTLFMESVLDLPTAQLAGHDEAEGSVTDIGELASRGLEVSMINISSGYHNPHSKRETVVLDELMISVDLAHEIATTMGNHKWVHAPTYHSYFGNRYDAKYDSPKWGGSKGRGYSSFTGSTYREEQEELDLREDKQYREELFTELEFNHGYLRDLDNLDAFSTEELEDLLDSFGPDYDPCEAAGGDLAAGEGPFTINEETGLLEKIDV